MDKYDSFYDEPESVSMLRWVARIIFFLSVVANTASIKHHRKDVHGSLEKTIIQLNNRIDSCCKLKHAEYPIPDLSFNVIPAVDSDTCKHIGKGLVNIFFREVPSIGNQTPAGQISKQAMYSPVFSAFDSIVGIKDNNLVFLLTELPEDNEAPVPGFNYAFVKTYHITWFCEW